MTMKGLGCMENTLSSLENGDGSRVATCFCEPSADHQRPVEG